jgi:hypothetical protein
MRAKRLAVGAFLPLFLLAAGCNPNVKAPPPEQLAAHAPIIFVSALIVIVVDALVLWATVRRHSS